MKRFLFILLALLGTSYPALADPIPLGPTSAGAVSASTVPLSGITGLGTGISAALGTNIGSPGAPVLFNGAGGTPLSLTLTNATGLPATSITAGALTSSVTINNTNWSGTGLALTNLAAQSAGTFLANVTGGSASPTAVAFGTGAEALIVGTASGTGGLVGNISPTISNSLNVLLGGSGVYTADGNVLLAQSSSMTALQIYNSVIPASYLFYGITRSVLDQEPGTTVQGTAAYDAYIWNNVAQSTTPNQRNAVGLFTVAVNAVAGAASWGINPTCSDAHGVSNVASICIGAEFDFTSNNNGSTIEGISLILQGTATLSSASAVQVSIVPGASAKWVTGFSTGDGSVTGNALVIGASAVSGTTISSQTISANFFDSASAEHALVLKAISIGTNGAFAINDNIRANGFWLQTAATGASPAIFAQGTGTDINMLIGAKGTGIINVQSNFAPLTNLGETLGTSSLAWSQVYANTISSVGAIMSVNAPSGQAVALTVNGVSIAAAFPGLFIPGSAGISLGGASNIWAGAWITLGSDAGVTDNTVCNRTSTSQMFVGSGTLGICLGTSSFRAAKDDVMTITDGLEQLTSDRVRPVNYTYLPGYGDGGARMQYGFIAEEYAQAFPILSRFDEDGHPTGTDMYGLMPVIVSAIKELKIANDKLKQELTELRRKVN